MIRIFTSSEQLHPGWIRDFRVRSGFYPNSGPAAVSGTNIASLYIVESRKSPNLQA